MLFDFGRPRAQSEHSNSSRDLKTLRSSHRNLKDEKERGTYRKQITSNLDGLFGRHADFTLSSGCKYAIRQFKRGSVTITTTVLEILTSRKIALELESSSTNWGVTTPIRVWGTSRTKFSGAENRIPHVVRANHEIV